MNVPYYKVDKARQIIEEAEVQLKELYEGKNVSLQFRIGDVKYHLQANSRIRDQIMYELIEKAAHLHYLKPSDITGKTRVREFANVRFMIFKVAYDVLRIGSLKQIGLFFNGRDHSTVINGIRKCNDMIDTEKVFALQYYEIKAIANEIYTKLT